MRADDIRDEVQALGRTKFVARYGPYWLVLTDPESLDGVADFVNTASRTANEIASSNQVDKLEFRPILADPGERMVTVGRERPAKIQLAHKRVSKLHAYFLVGGGMLQLADVGSKNGTRLNSVRLDTEKPVAVDVGDTIRFGDVTATIWGVEDLLAAIES